METRAMTHHPPMTVAWETIWSLIVDTRRSLMSTDRDTNHRRTVGIAFMRLSTMVLMLGEASAVVQAGQLPGNWTARDGGGTELKMLADGRPETACSLTVIADASPSVTVDLGSPRVIQRVYFRGDAAGKGQDVPFPVGMWTGVKTRVVMLAGETLDTLKPVAEEYPVAMDSLYEAKKSGGVRGNPVANDPETVNTEGDFRFPPLEARYIKLEARGLPAGAQWKLGEIEVNGFPAWAAKREAVILPAGADTPLTLAARDLSYYLGEMLGRPVPIVAPDAAEAYSGPRFRIADLKSLAGTADEMAANLKSGKLPTNPVNVELDGKDVVFRAWPYRNVLVSAWAFLESQGVRWVYPDPHGDVVPSRKELNLGVLPLRYAPPVERIYANLDVQPFCPSMPWDLHNRWVFYPTESYLYFWRNHWLASSNGFTFGGGAEVPLPEGPKNDDEAAKLVKEEFREGRFNGYPHNNCAIASGDLKAHPDWMGLKREGPEDRVGKRSPEVTPCYTNQGLIDFLAAKANAWAAVYPAGSAKRFNLLPTDAALDCECDSCLALNQPLVKPDIPYVAFPTYYASDAYYHLVTEVAKRCQKASPNVSFFALAYANVFAPPRKISKFPDNVIVEVCAYGHMNLPPEAPQNAPMKSAIEEWASKCRRLETYSYVLLNEDAQSWPMPLPLVSAMVAWAKLQHSLGALSGGTQGSVEMIRYCPWNFYAFPRIHWDIGTDSQSLLEEFFEGYFGESGDAMLAYYKAAEDYHIGNNVSLYSEGYQYRLTPGAFPFHVLQEMSGHLEKAEAKATGWVTKQRVAAMREGFDWLVKSTGVGAERLANPAAIPTLGPGRPPLTVAVTEADVGRPKTKDFALQNRSRIGKLVQFEADGEYVVSFTGAGFTDPRHRKDRKLAAYVGDAYAEAQPIPDAKGEYRFVVKATKGVWEVGLRSMLRGEGPFYMEEFTISAK